MGYREFVARVIRRYWVPALTTVLIVTAVSMIVRVMVDQKTSARGSGTAVPISYDADGFKRLRFFDADGTPLISYYQHNSGRYDLFEIGSGKSHPTYGYPLTPVMPDVVLEIERQLAGTRPVADKSPVVEGSPDPAEPSAAPMQPPLIPLPERRDAATPRTLPSPSPEPPAMRELEIPRDSAIRVTLKELLTTKTATVGQEVEATLAEPLVAGDVVVAQRGSQAWGRISQVSDAPRKGKPRLALELERVSIVSGERLRLGVTELVIEGEGQSGLKRGLKVVGGAIAGALVGAAADGKEGTAKGAVIGAGAGTAAAMLAKGKSVELPAQTVLEFRLNEATRVSLPAETLAGRAATSEGAKR